MNKFTTVFIASLLSFNFSFAKSSVITSWKDVSPQKGYILSMDLQKDKECSHIWTKQIKEFLKMNPHIKNADLILVNQKIKVQSCKMEVQEASTEQISQIQKEESKKPYIPQWFAGIFAGASMVSEHDKDTSKRGMSAGIKIGHMRNFQNDKLFSIGLGFTSNKSRTSDDNDILGVYEIKTFLVSLESSLLFPMTDSIQLGPKAMIVTGKDISFSDKDKGQTLGAYLGLESLIGLDKNLHLSLDVQQRIDEIKRTNILGNIGLRLDF